MNQDKVLSDREQAPDDAVRKIEALHREAEREGYDNAAAYLLDVLAILADEIHETSWEYGYPNTRGGISPEVLFPAANRSFRRRPAGPWEPMP